MLISTRPELCRAVPNSGVTHSPQLLRDNKTQQPAEEVQPNIALRCAMSTQYVGGGGGGGGASISGSAGGGGGSWWWWWH